jgi:hypothetical protein
MSVLDYSGDSDPAQVRGHRRSVAAIGTTHSAQAQCAHHPAAQAIQRGTTDTRSGGVDTGGQCRAMAQCLDTGGTTDTRGGGVDTGGQCRAMAQCR